MTMELEDMPVPCQGGRHCFAETEWAFIYDCGHVEPICAHHTAMYTPDIENGTGLNCWACGTTRYQIEVVMF